MLIYEPRHNSAIEEASDALAAWLLILLIIGIVWGLL